MEGMIKCLRNFMSSKKIDSSQLEKTAGGEKTTAPAGIAVSS
jgi:hypothetical protein